MNNNLQVVSTSSFILICLLFFLPFLSIDCSDKNILTITGMELAMGFTMPNVPSYDGSGDMHNESKNTGFNQYAALAFLSSFLGIIFSFLLRGKKYLKSAVIIFAGLISLSLLILQLDINSKLTNDAKPFLIRLNYELGYWLCLVIPIILIAYTLIMKRQSIERKEVVAIKPDNERFSLSCPKCNAVFSVESSLIGRLAECSECKTKIRIQAPS